VSDSDMHIATNKTIDFILLKIYVFENKIWLKATKLLSTRQTYGCQERNQLIFGGCQMK
jgi:hypothetical protein